VTTPHTTFGLLEVRSPSESGLHRVVKLDDGLFAEQVELRRVDVRFGWDEAEKPFCGKCRLPIRPVDAGGGAVVWITENDCERQPCCSETTFDRRLTDEEVVAQMFHEPDRSVASWCHGAAVHVDDDAGTVRLLARTERHKVAVELRRLPDGGVSVRTVRRRRRRRKESS
jgi:hypothetical protein